MAHKEEPRDFPMKIADWSKKKTHESLQMIAGVDSKRRHVIQMQKIKATN